MATARHPKATFFVQRHLFSGLTSFAELEKKIAALPDEQSRGAAFEVFAEAYLATQRIHQAREVWAGTIPPSLQQRLRLPLKDMGVDGVFITTSDETACYQVKFRSGRPSLTWSELSTFFGLADVGVQRLVFTNCDDISNTAEERQGAVFVRGSDLDGMTAEDFQVIEAWLVGSTAPKKKKSPLKHQDAALKDILNGLTRYPRATALMACGSGKTLVALWTAERLNARTVLVLLPSLALVRQTLHEWLHETNWPEVEYRCVCSDSAVQLEEDALIVRPSELDFPVTTQSAAVRRFLERQTSAVRIVFSTYHSAAVVAEAVAGLPPFDFGVFDEAHKTAGREGMKFALALNDNNLPISRRLFLTATPRHYDVAPENKSGEGRTVLSMDVPEIYGQVVHRLPFSTAAKLGIITDYKVLISIVTSDMVTDELLRRGVVIVEGEEIKARQVANQIALKSAIEQNGVSKVFTFHSKVDSARSFTSDSPEGIVTHLPGFHCAHIHGAMSMAYRKGIMGEFADAPRAILSNARCLTEGVDVPAVDMVAFLSPRRSLVDIVQATGRAMRLSPGKKFGYVLVPLYVEKERGETIKEAVKRSNFDEVWNVLRKLQEHDDLLAQIISEMRMQRGETGGFDDTRLRERVQFICPAISLESLLESITAACIDAIGDGWFERYGQFVDYQKKHGKRDMPARWPENQKLATWVVNQRVLQRDGVLEEEKIELLNRIGFKWSPHESKWRTQYLALLDFRKQFDHCRVPQNWEGSNSLAHWVKTQRNDYGKGELSGERIAALEKIGFEWLVGVATWEERFAELCAYKERFHDTLVQVKWPENPLLGRWVSSQRYIYNRGKLNKEYEDRLNLIGFVWKVPRIAKPAKASISKLEEQWQEMFGRFKEYAAAHGVSTVVVVDDETLKLNRWMLTQRQMKKRTKLSESRIKALEEIGFVWQRVKKTPVPKPAIVPSETEIPSRSWDELFSDLADFFKLHGHCNVPVDWQANPELADWVGRQRAAKRQNRLTTDQLRRMNEIGFAWSVHDGDWGSMFAKLAEHLRPMHNGKPRDAVMSAELRRWTLTQRQLKKRSELELERERKLNSIGFEWQPHSRQWQEMFDALRKFHADNGHCRVPSKWPINPKLASWVGTQRAHKSSRILSAERIAALDAIGFVWRVAKQIETQTWDAMFEALKKYKEIHKNCLVPQRSRQHPRLADWVSEQRVQHNKHRLDAERVRRLDELGFDWNPVTTKWDEMFQQLVEFKRKHNHTNVPQRSALGRWVHNQRLAKKLKRPIVAERAKRLDEIGFVWTLIETVSWEDMFASLVKFKKIHGHCNVSQKRAGEHKRLGKWVNSQRTAYSRGKINPARKQQLDSIGFVWNLRPNLVAVR